MKHLSLSLFPSSIHTHLSFIFLHLHNYRIENIDLSIHLGMHGFFAVAWHSGKWLFLHLYRMNESDILSMKVLIYLQDQYGLHLK